MDFSFNLNRMANASAWRLLPNRWDFVAFPLIICVIAMAAIGFHETMAPISTLQDAGDLARSVEPARIRAAHHAAHAGGAWSRRWSSRSSTARSRRRAARAGMVLVPILDILQSVPVLGYISFTVTFFLALFPGRVLGAELRGDLRDLHEPGVEHDVQLLPVAAHGAARPRRSRRAAFI